MTATLAQALAIAARLDAAMNRAGGAELRRSAGGSEGTGAGTDGVAHAPSDGVGEPSPPARLTHPAVEGAQA